MSAPPHDKMYMAFFAQAQSETILFLPVRCSFAVAVAAGGLGSLRIFQIDFSYLCNEV